MSFELPDPPRDEDGVLNVKHPTGSSDGCSAATVDRIEQLEAALRVIEVEVYGRPEPFCRRIAEQIKEVLGVAPA